MKQRIVEKVSNSKRNFCDKIIVFLANLIRKCSKKEEFIKHLNSIEENKKDSLKFKNIDSKKEKLFEAIENLKKVNFNLYQHNSELLTAFEMVDKLLDLNDINKAKEICKVIKEDINKKENDE